MAFEAHGCTHAGRVRTANQDRILVLNEIGCFAVWDGMGGQRCGDVAAEIGVTVFQHYIESSRHPSEVTWPFGYNMNLSLDANRLLTSIRLANRQVASRADQDLKCAGMGTTVAAVLCRDNRIAAANVGDSRVYHLRGGELKQLSVDDTMAGLMVSKGVIHPKCVPDHPMRSILTQAVGSHAELDVHLREEEMAAGDTLLLCSDGLYSVLGAAAITQTLGAAASLEQRASELIEQALANNVSDNVSVIVVEYK
jgi:serine/threonine protein phosphatase PrpC